MKLAICFLALLGGYAMLAFGFYFLYVDLGPSASVMSHVGFALIAIAFLLSGLGCELIGEIRSFGRGA
jgi:hypothetical protein